MSSAVSPCAIRRVLRHSSRRRANFFTNRHDHAAPRRDPRRERSHRRGLQFHGLLRVHQRRTTRLKTRPAHRQRHHRPVVELDHDDVATVSPKYENLFSYARMDRERDPHARHIIGPTSCFLFVASAGAATASSIRRTFRRRPRIADPPRSLLHAAVKTAPPSGATLLVAGVMLMPSPTATIAVTLAPVESTTRTVSRTFGVWPAV
jgi:hypothetical protein